MKTSIIILYLCTLLLLQGCTKESSISDPSIDTETDINNIEDPSDTMYTLSLPQGDWVISIQPEQEIVQVSDPQGIEYRYSLSELSWDTASERQPQMVCDDTGCYAVLIYPKIDPDAEEAQGAVILNLMTGEMLCSYDHVDAAIFLQAFHREDEGIAQSLTETGYTIGCETTFANQSTFKTTFTLQAKKISLRITGTFYYDLPEAPDPSYAATDRMYTDRIVWGEDTEKFLSLYDTATEIYVWLFAGDELVQHTEDTKYIGDAPYYEIDDPAFAELQISTTADLESYLQNVFTESFVDELLTREMYVDIDGKIHVVGAARGGGTTYRNPAYSLEQIDDTHMDLVCQAKEYSAGHMEPEAGVVEFRYRFVCVADAWYLDSYPELLWKFT